MAMDDVSFASSVFLDKCNELVWLKDLGSCMVVDRR
jgi:hypothetical protein